MDAPWRDDQKFGGMSDDDAAKASWLAEQGRKPRERLVPIPWSQIHSLPRREPIVGGLLDRAAMSVVFGGSNTGKTFWTLDLCASIALGQEWRGRRIRHGAVIYIAAEGGLGIEERLTAYRMHHGVEAADVPLYVIPEPIDLCKSSADVELLLKRLKALPAEPHIELIVVDTLSRALAGGNENGADDMGSFVRHCDRLRMETKRMRRGGLGATPFCELLQIPRSKSPRATCPASPLLKWSSSGTNLAATSLASP
jgi:RecA/RadA recombinase